MSWRLINTHSHTHNLCSFNWMFSLYLYLDQLYPLESIIYIAPRGDTDLCTICVT